MTKGELVAKIAGATKISKALAGRTLDAALEGITIGMKRGKVTLVGFGSFSVVMRKARTGRNPRTGEAIKIAATKVPKFTAGKALKMAVRK